MNISRLLVGVVGSHAYGLDHADSDTDRMGVFAAPTLEVAGLDWHTSKESIVSQGLRGDDSAMHEVGKFLRLTLKANPTVTELLWLEDYEILTEYGQWLINIRENLLSSKYVSDTYFGYAKSQLDKFHTKDFKRKHAKHCLRLLRQGAELLETGSLTVRVANPQEYFDLDDMSNGQVIEVLVAEFRKFDLASLESHSPLPTVPDKNHASTVLDAIRTSHL